MQPRVAICLKALGRKQIKYISTPVACCTMYIVRTHAHMTTCDSQQQQADLYLTLLLLQPLDNGQYDCIEVEYDVRQNRWAKRYCNGICERRESCWWPKTQNEQQPVVIQQNKHSIWCKTHTYTHMARHDARECLYILGDFRCCCGSSKRLTNGNVCIPVPYLLVRLLLLLLVGLGISITASLCRTLSVRRAVRVYSRRINCFRGKLVPFISWPPHTRILTRKQETTRQRSTWIRGSEREEKKNNTNAAPKANFLSIYFNLNVIYHTFFTWLLILC